MPSGCRSTCVYCNTIFYQVDNERLCDLCIDEGIIDCSDGPEPTVTSRGFPCNPSNSYRTIASCTALDHAPRSGNARQEYFDFRRELAAEYDGCRKGYADISDFEFPDDPDKTDAVIKEIVSRCISIRTGK